MSSEFKNNAILGPINAWIFKALSGYMNYIFGKSKNALFKDHPETIVEIGPGAGANMRYLRRGTTVIAIEPNLHMHANLTKAAQKYGINLYIETGVGEEINLAENSVDFVVCTLVLCSVSDPVRCIEQIKCILKPGGTFAFIEHVKAADHSLLAYLQNLVHKPWHWFFEGCHTNRDTKSVLEAAGFESLELKAYNSYSPFIPISPQIMGKAIK